MLRKLCLLSAIVGALFASWISSSPADAIKREFSSVYNCHATGGQAIDSSYAMANNSSTSRLILRCDAPDSSTFAKVLTDRIYVDGRDGTTVDRLSAQACVSWSHTGGGRCGSTARSSIADVRHKRLSVPVNGWSLSAFHYGYIAIGIPPRQGSSRSSVKGIRYEID